MKKILTLVLISTFAIGCSDTTGTEELRAHVAELNKQNERTDKAIYFKAGEVSCLCELMYSRPDMFDKNAIKDMGEACAKYKDFETFYNSYESMLDAHKNQNNPR